MHKQNKNINQEVKTIKDYMEILFFFNMEILKLKNTITELKKIISRVQQQNLSGRRKNQQT